MKNNNRILILFGMLVLFSPLRGMEDPLEGEKKGERGKVVRVLEKKREKKKREITPDFTQATINLERDLSKASREQKIEAFREQQIEALNKKIEQFNQDQDELRKYNPIIMPIQSQLKRPDALELNMIKKMNYSLKLIQEKDVKEIIKEIRQQLSLSDKLDILNYLDRLPNPDLTKEELRLWLKKKTEIKKVIENLEVKQAIQKETEKLLIEAKIAKEFTGLRHEQEEKELNLLQSMEKSFDDLLERRIKLKDYIAQLQVPKNSEEMKARDEYQEELDLVSQKITLLAEQLSIEDYESFTTKKLWVVLELLTNLKKSFKNTYSDQYKALETKIYTINDLLTLRMKEKVNLEEVAQEIVAEQEEQQNLEDLLEKANRRRLAESKEQQEQKEKQKRNAGEMLRGTTPQMLKKVQEKKQHYTEEQRLEGEKRAELLWQQEKEQFEQQQQKGKEQKLIEPTPQEIQKALDSVSIKAMSLPSLTPQLKEEIIKSTILLAKVIEQSGANIEYIRSYIEPLQKSAVFAEGLFNYILQNTNIDEQNRKNFIEAWKTVKTFITSSPIQQKEEQRTQQSEQSTKQTLFTQQQQMTEQEKKALAESKKEQVEEGRKQEQQTINTLLKQRDELLDQEKKLEEKEKKLKEKIEEIKKEESEKSLGQYVWESITDIFNAITYPLTFFWSWLWTRQE